MKAQEIDKIISQLEDAEIAYCRLEYGDSKILIVRDENSKSKPSDEKSEKMAIDDAKAKSNENKVSKDKTHDKIAETKVTNQDDKTDEKVEEKPLDKATHDIKSKFIGYFFRGKPNEEKPFIKLRDVVEKNQTVCIVKTLNVIEEIKSDIDGKVVEILVEDGQAVEYGQPLVRLQLSE